MGPKRKIKEGVMRQHNAQCERRPGGEYDGQLIGGGSDGFQIREPMPIPCHCQARADGIAKAERELR